MSKRKREIQKRKKLAEETLEGESFLADEPVADDGAEDDEGPGGSSARELTEPQSHFDDSQIVSAPPSPPAREKPSRKEGPQVRKPGGSAMSETWLGQNKENLLLGLLVLYVVLLGLGTVGELFEIEWILNFFLFK